MWRFLVGLWLLAGLSPEAGTAQQWTGTATLSVTAGHQTNAYLDPVLRSWDTPSDPTFAALTPHVSLSRDAGRSRLDLSARTRLYPRRAHAPQFVQGYARYQYQLSPDWTIGALGGGTRYRFVTPRNSGWALPAVTWTASSGVLTLRGGVTRRYAALSQSSPDRQTSAVVALSGHTWVTNRLRAAGRLYWSNGRTNASDVQFGGTGGSVRGTYWPTNEWSLEAETAVEQVRYGTGGSSPARDRIGRVGLKAQWHARSSVTLFAHTQASAARLAQRPDALDTDLHVSVGVRLQASRVLGGTAPPPPRRRICIPVENGLRVRIPYDGSGTPHVTGDFNGWSLPGVPLTPADGDTWTTTLSLGAGEYAYRIRIVDGDEARWLDLPSYAQTAEDSFGGTNGVCTVQ